MEATISEIAPDVFRISVFPPGAPISFGCFLIRDDQPAMIETGLRSVYGLVHDAVRRLIDPATLRYLVIPHFEMDECGSLNQFLTLAPHAEPVASPLGASVTIGDFSDRPARALAHGEALPLGRKTLRAIVTPWVHYWDSMLVYDETDRLLFTSDLFMQPGDREPITDADRSAEVVEFCRYSGLLPSQKHLEAALDRVEPLAVDTLACHHGSVLAGDPRRYYRALREHTVGDVIGAPFYDQRAPGAGY
jgi:flavorubredoxin